MQYSTTTIYTVVVVRSAVVIITAGGGWVLSLCVFLGGPECAVPGTEGSGSFSLFSTYLLIGTYLLRSFSRGFLQQRIEAFRLRFLSITLYLQYIFLLNLLKVTVGGSDYVRYVENVLTVNQ